MRVYLETFGHGFIILCGMLILIMAGLCVLAAWSSQAGREAPKWMVIIGWTLTAIAACLLAGWKEP